MTTEDETRVTNLVIESAVFEKHRWLILLSGIIGCRGQVQHEGGLTHLITKHFINLSDPLRSMEIAISRCVCLVNEETK